jgi:hypothetical protein
MKVMVVVSKPGPPPVVVKISAKIDSRKIISIISTTETARPGGDVEVAQLLQIGGAVHARRFQLLAVHRLQGRHEDQAGERQPLPGDHHDDGKQGWADSQSTGVAPKKMLICANKP